MSNVKLMHLTLTHSLNKSKVKVNNTYITHSHGSVRVF